ncbi:MAG: hypothetical protein ACRDI3_06300 [Actinomycetota bacterium]
MIEVQMVKRMIVRGLYLAPFLVFALWIWNGSEYAVSGAFGLAMTLGNLLLAAKVIGTVAERNPRLVLVAAMVAFASGLGLLTIAAFILKGSGIVYFPVTGFTLIGSHLLLVLWEGAGTKSNRPVHAREI